MLLDLEDGRLRARISSLSGNRIRLVLDYPHEAAYRTRILTALSDILRPATGAPDTGSTPRDTEAGR